MKKEFSLYFKNGSTAYKITEQKFPQIFNYLVSNWKTIKEDYYKFYKNRKVGRPSYTLRDEIFEQLKTELKLKPNVNCFTIYYDSISSSLCEINNIKTQQAKLDFKQKYGFGVSSGQYLKID